MCGRYAIGRSARELADDLGAAISPTLAAWRPSFDLTPGSEGPVLVEVPERRLGLARFGLAPEGPGKRLVFNARAETLSERPLFAEAAARRRCVVPTDGFFEWEQRGSRRIPHFVHALHPADAHAGTRPLLLLAGLYEVAHDAETGERRTRFVIVTVPAVPPVARVHDRMPLVVPRGLVASWLARGELSPEEALAAIASATPVPLAMHPVSGRALAQHLDGPSLLEPVDPDDAETGLLAFGDDELDARAPRRGPR
jgi:putative SOS response-associated peptidase YedK